MKDVFMKKDFFCWGRVIFCLLVILALMGCGGGKYPLNGIWTASYDGDQVSIAFIDNLCFLIRDTDVDGATYIFANKEGFLLGRDGDNNSFTVKGNALNLTIDASVIVFTKDSSAKAPAQISGIWNGPKGWILAFVNDKVFLIDEDSDDDFGKYTFSNNKGSFKSEEYQYEVEFVVKGNTMDVLIDSYDNVSSFTRVR
jgi:hypothetical protein